MIICRVLISLVPFVCHFLKVNLEEQTKPLPAIEQRVSARLQQNPDLARLEKQFTRPGQQNLFATDPAPAVKPFTVAASPPPHDLPDIALLAALAFPASILPHHAAPALRPASTTPLPPTWAGSLAYSAQAPPTES